MSAVEEMKTLVEYYQSDDYKSDYYYFLMEDLREYGSSRLISVANKEWGIILHDDRAHKVVEYIINNLDDYVSDYTNYWVGTESISAIAFGENEEEIPQGFDRDKDDDMGFYIPEDGEYMYFDMSDRGLNVSITYDTYVDILDMIGL